MASTPSVPKKFHPPKSFSFPKRSFGCSGNQRSFRSEWCEEFEWLHYDTATDTAYCHLCLCTEAEKRFLASTKRDPAFISRGYCNWKDAKVAFTKHIESACHKEAVQADKLLKRTGDIGEMLSTAHSMEKALNREMLRRIMQNLRFLARQGLAVRGSNGGEDSNFTQLLRLRANDCPAVTGWMDKKTNKYTSGDIQNELLQIMALSLLRDVTASIKNSHCGWYTVMADECTDVSNKEQFVICIRWVDADLCSHEDAIGLYHVDSIDAKTLVATIEDVLLRLCMNISQCRGQCYDGAANMAGSKGGVAAYIQKKQPKAVLTHCYGHALNLAVGDCIKKLKICCNALDVAFKIVKLIRFSPKRNAAFDRIRVENYMENDVPSHGVRALCPTRWTVRGDALQSILDHWSTLCHLWDQCLDTLLDPDAKARVIGVKAQMSGYSLLFGFHLSKTILMHTDNLSRTLQKQSMSAAEGQEIAKLTVVTLEKMRSEEAFKQFFATVEVSRKNLDVDTPSLPRKRKAPARFEVGSGAGNHVGSVEDLYRQKYFEALDLVIESIKNRFQQPGYAVYRNLEDVLVKAANGDPYKEELKAVHDFYGDDFDLSSLSVQLQSLSSFFSRRERITIGDCVAEIQSMTAAQQSYFSEVCKLIRLILVMPATNAISERSFSTMRRLKTYLRSTMLQCRLNHIMLLSINKDRIDYLDLNAIGDEFVRCSEHRLRQFGHFQ